MTGAVDTQHCGRLAAVKHLQLGAAPTCCHRLIALPLQLLQLRRQLLCGRAAACSSRGARVRACAGRLGTPLQAAAPGPEPLTGARHLEASWPRAELAAARQARAARGEVHGGAGAAVEAAARCGRQHRLGRCAAVAPEGPRCAGPRERRRHGSRQLVLRIGSLSRGSWAGFPMRERECSVAWRGAGAGPDRHRGDTVL